MMEAKCCDCDATASYELDSSRVRCKVCGLDVSYEEYMKRYARKLVQKGIIVSEGEWNPDSD